ncbi:MAG: phospho-N-acetylmuramoyl-pentapeptide-transferase [Verrucomicrobiota bacterium]|nr:phospho-N-acetylmuramoyl-pentapeptide-transferase [Verrucomicrobiota bacterium]
MMYLLHYLSEGATSDFWKAFNVFQYITFRAIAAAVSAFLISLVLGNCIIRKLISLKVGQPIRTKEEVHRLFELHGQKAGTPTMGGVLLLGAVIFSTLFWARLDNSAVWLLLLVIVWCGVLGFWDDYLKVVRKNAAGVSERTKLIGQFAIAGVVTAYFLCNPAIEIQARSLYVPFYKNPIIGDLSWFTFFFFALVIVGSSNAVNLTDGLDGLAAGCTATTAFAYAVFAYAAGHMGIAQYLQIPFYPFVGELTVMCMALAGASCGFLWFNCYPAKVFMGDTGALAIGGTLGVVAICCKQELLLAVVGGVFVIEAVSVVIQRSWFKITKARFGEGRRVFRMAPIHHHFELMGWKETTVVARFWILSVMFAFLGLATLKLR